MQTWNVYTTLSQLVLPYYLIVWVKLNCMGNTYCLELDIWNIENLLCTINSHHHIVWEGMTYMKFSELLFGLHFARLFTSVPYLLILAVSDLIVVKWSLWCSISPVLLLFGMSKLTIIMSQVLDILFFFSILLFKLYNNNKYQQISLLKYNIAQFSFPIFFFFFLIDLM